MHAVLCRFNYYTSCWIICSRTFAQQCIPLSGSSISSNRLLLLLIFFKVRHFHLLHITPSMFLWISKECTSYLSHPLHYPYLFRNQLLLATMVFFQGRYSSVWGFLHTWLPFCVVVVIGVSGKSCLVTLCFDILVLPNLQRANMNSWLLWLILAAGILWLPDLLILLAGHNRVDSELVYPPHLGIRTMQEMCKLSFTGTKCSCLTILSRHNWLFQQSMLCQSMLCSVIAELLGAKSLQPVPIWKARLYVWDNFWCIYFRNIEGILPSILSLGSSHNNVCSVRARFPWLCF
jgi:hypothetical protein